MSGDAGGGWGTGWGGEGTWGCAGVLARRYICTHTNQRPTLYLTTPSKLRAQRILLTVIQIIPPHTPNILPILAPPPLPPPNLGPPLVLAHVRTSVRLRRCVVGMEGLAHGVSIRCSSLSIALSLSVALALGLGLVRTLVRALGRAAGGGEEVGVGGGVGGALMGCTRGGGLRGGGAPGGW